MDTIFIDEIEKIPTERIKEIEDLLQFAAGFLEIAEDTEMSVTSTDNIGTQMINRDYRGKDVPTDTTGLALESERKDELPIIFDDEELAELPHNLGDSTIPTERAAEQAVEYGHTLEQEMGFLAIHGLLYLNGYDHMGPEDEKEIFGLQKEILDAYDLRRWADREK